MKDSIKSPRDLPSVDALLRREALGEVLRGYSTSFVTVMARRALEEARSRLAAGKTLSAGEIEGLLMKKISKVAGGGLREVVNATGTILHTNLGRAPLSPAAVEKAALAGKAYTNLEFDLERGARGQRDEAVAELVKVLTGAEDALVVNNNAAAVLITLNTLALGKEVIISRGELIEIGGSFRLPEIIERSGCRLIEVGTTNRTHPRDYERAVTGETALILKAHRSNFTMAGFTREVPLRELVYIGKKKGLPVVEDLGSGSLVDLSDLGLPHEPTVGERIRAGAACVTFSGDKLLGGPQAGIVAGKREIVDRIRKNPLKRALRVGKLTLAALEETLKLYLRPGDLFTTLPVLKLISRPLDDIKEAAGTAAERLKEVLGGEYTITVEKDSSVVGGGAMPGGVVPTWVVAIGHRTKKPGEVYARFLKNEPPIIGRIKKDLFMLDPRCVDDPLRLVPRPEAG